MNDKNLAFSYLMLALLNIKRELGLSVATTIELSVYAAMINLANTHNNIVSIEDMKNHGLLQDLSKPSLYRAIRSLSAQGRCIHIGSARSGTYMLT